MRELELELELAARGIESVAGAKTAVYSGAGFSGTTAVATADLILLGGASFIGFGLLYLINDQIMKKLTSSVVDASSSGTDNYIDLADYQDLNNRLNTKLA